ncbi:MAG: tetratricopeptide repeat protein [Candidatus Omnitrophica bacterium]|nr:tetratricopeptide repeat protein [Candidatus Omnitrophota bacterium]MDD5610781.1 tetratricopeptide repeat protein [Candidatus Omnitrophota bacterium]
MRRRIISLSILLSIFFISAVAYSDNFHDIRVSFLKGDYTACIDEGEKALVDAYHSKNADELYYLLGESYLKSGNFLRAADIFEILVKEFKNSKFRNDAYIGLGDASFLEGDFAAAEAKYRELLKSDPSTKLASLVDFKLAQVLLKQGKWDEAKKYLNKLQEDFPRSLEQQMAKLAWTNDFYFTLQVGSFSTEKNALALQNKLTEKGYTAFIQESQGPDKTVYRVRVGKLNTRQEAEELEKTLTSQGFPVRIFP